MPASTAGPGSEQLGQPFVFGRGPIYPFIYGVAPDTGSLPLSKMGRQPGDTAGYWTKVLWRAAPFDKEPAVIRGNQIDGPNLALFSPGSDSPPLPVLRFPIETNVRDNLSDQGWRSRPSSIFVPSAGCYGFQVDGIGFSEVVVVEVTGL